MTSWFLDLAIALYSEWRQRYEIRCLIDRLGKDQRTLDDLGFTSDWLANELKREQRTRSPLRLALRRQRKGRGKATRRAAHDFW